VRRTNSSRQSINFVDGVEEVREWRVLRWRRYVAGRIVGRKREIRRKEEGDPHALKEDGNKAGNGWSSHLLTVSLLPTQQLSQTGEAAASLKELVSQQLVGCSTAADVHAKTNTQEGLELLAQLLGLLQTGCTVGGNQVQGLEGLLVEVWGLGLDHLNSHDTQRPAVDLGSVLLLLDHLGRHPVGCTDHGGTLALRLGQLSTEAEIGDLDVADSIKQDVVTLDITVNDVLAVQMGQSLASL
jgi:hypothetical protein